MGELNGGHSGKIIPSLWGWPPRIVHKVRWQLLVPMQSWRVPGLPDASISFATLADQSDPAYPKPT